MNINNTKNQKSNPKYKIFRSFFLFDFITVFNLNVYCSLVVSYLILNVTMTVLLIVI